MALPAWAPGFVPDEGVAGASAADEADAAGWATATLVEGAALGVGSAAAEAETTGSGDALAVAVVVGSVLLHAEVTRVTRATTPADEGSREKRTKSGARGELIEDMFPRRTTNGKLAVRRTPDIPVRLP